MSKVKHAVAAYVVSRWHKIVSRQFAAQFAKGLALALVGAFLAWLVRITHHEVMIFAFALGFGVFKIRLFFRLCHDGEASSDARGIALLTGVVSIAAALGLTALFIGPQSGPGEYVSLAVVLVLVVVSVIAVRRGDRYAARLSR
jgi:hypothetical protein